MQEQRLRLYSIMPLDMENIDARCEDMRRQYETGVTTCVLFNMTLVPEGNPPVDKVGKLCAKYAVFKEKLDAIGVPNGVLVQATIGHGWVLGEMFPYQRYTNLTDGDEPAVVCPSDVGFHDYLFKIFATIAAHHPDCIMVDDDFRLISRPGRGCACPWHMARTRELTGVNDLTRKTLLDEILAWTPTGQAYNDAFIQSQKESVLAAAKMMRAGIDSVDPQMPGSYCCEGANAEFAGEIAKILAGEGNPVMVRINNGNYTASGARGVTRPFMKAAQQIAKLKDTVDIILAETDTCPQNRYSTGAMQLHTHFTGTILEGATGAKQWITRLPAYEPKSGEAFRKKLASNRGFYEELAKLVPTLRYRGCRIPMADKLNFAWPKGGITYGAWALCVLERLGLPVYFSAEAGGVTCMHGEEDSALTDGQIMEILSGPVFLASDTAKRLINRGFGEYLGVDVRPWTGKPMNKEQLRVNGNRCNVQVDAQELVKMSEAVIEDSGVYNTTDGENFTYLFPGSTIYKNAMGGTVVTFCGTPNAAFDITEAFSFLNESRKLQLIRLMEQLGQLPVYYPGDEEMYLRAADMEDGGLFAALFNLGFDPIENLELVCQNPVKRIEKLMPDGSRRAVDFAQDGSTLKLNCPCNTLDPVILFLY